MPFFLLNSVPAASPANPFASVDEPPQFYYDKKGKKRRTSGRPHGGYRYGTPGTHRALARGSVASLGAAHSVPECRVSCMMLGRGRGQAALTEVDTDFRTLRDIQE